jgi:hypothetical protein
MGQGDPGSQHQSAVRQRSRNLRPVFPLRVEHGCNDSRPLVAARDRNKSNRSIYDTDYGALTILLAEKALGKAAGAVLPGGSSLPAPLLLLEGGALGFDYGFCVEHQFRRGQSQGISKSLDPPRYDLFSTCYCASD